MPNLNKNIEQQVQKKIPHHFLRRLLKKKLKEKGIDEADLLDALTNHILSKSEETLHWSDGEDGSVKNVSIELTEQDVKQFEKDVRAFLDEQLPGVILNTVKDSAKALMKTLEKRWPEVKVDARNEMRHFRDRIDLRWAAGLDPLRMMLIASREVGQEFADKLNRSKAKTGIHKRQALLMLHMRGCQTTLEILTMLENGFPDGAYARWRTLYEISVVAFIIDRFGDEIAERYMAHDIVSMRDSVMNDFRYDGEFYDVTKLTDELRRLEKDYQATIAKFGKSFAGPYGWAAHSLEIKSPRFQDLEVALDWNSLPPDYKWASYKIHAGVAGTVRTLGSIGDSQIIHAGATNAGLDTPAINTAFSLLHISSLVFEKFNDMETQVQMQTLILLRDKVLRECRKATKKLEKDELELQSAVEI